ncbi:PREDICTED: chromatin modification-related protein MEAF6 [Tarenaya hassleriana]|uniref:chromatin modification-related protein MEAF6 n=1 Tax=Tarenaya hassleriana TaxID=28532 RepID=UPI00053C7B36|nr:PREDICTED: chromatin modification-related protein MEAF6 [Tarenaya hassleriana]
MKMSLGQKGSANPGAILTTLLNKREKLQEELRSVEKQVYELETSYLQESSHFGNALKGYEGFLSSSKSAASAKRSRKFQPEDRIFSLSSVTSPAAEELGVGRDDGRADVGTGRLKGGAFSVGQGKPKKGRAPATTREAKRSRLFNEPDFDDDDDHDMSLR